MSVNEFSYSPCMAGSFAQDPFDFASHMQSGSMMLPGFFGSPSMVTEPQVYPIEGFANAQSASQIHTKQPTSRKEKSLHILCQLFMHDYPDYPSAGQEILINLEEKSKQLKVERRRVYDIINVLESLNIVIRKQKNEYVWKGRVSLVETLATFKALADMHGVAEQLERVRLLELARESGFINSMEPIEDSASRAAESLAGAHEKKDKSLGVMAKKFVMLFLSAKNQVVTMDAAAKILAEEDPVKLAVSRKIRGYDLTCKSLKSFLEKGYCEPKHFPKIRRLYDIANVLKSLQLIKKEKLIDSGVRKAAFRWISYKPSNLHQFYPDLSIVPQRPKTSPQGSPPSKKSRDFFMTECATAVSMLSKKEKICAGTAASNAVAVTALQESLKEMFPIEKKLQPLLRTPGKSSPPEYPPAATPAKQTHFIQSVPLHNCSLWLLPKTEPDTHSTCLPNGFSLNSSHVYDAFMSSSAPQTAIHEESSRHILKYSPNISRCHDLSFSHGLMNEDFATVAKDGVFCKYESPRNPLLCQMESTEDEENENISDSLVNHQSSALAPSSDENSIFVHTDCTKKVDVKFPLFLPAGGRAVLEEATLANDSVDEFNHTDAAMEEEMVRNGANFAKTSTDVPEISDVERDKAILSFVYDLAPSTSQSGDVNDYLLSLNSNAGPTNPIKSFPLSIPDTTTCLERPIGITCAPLSALFPLEYPATWNYFLGGYETTSALSLPGFNCPAPSAFPWCNPALATLDYAVAPPYGAEVNPGAGVSLGEMDGVPVTDPECLTSSAAGGGLCDPGSTSSVCHRPPEMENLPLGANESGIYMGLGVNSSYCDNQTTTASCSSGPHTPASVSHEYLTPQPPLPPPAPFTAQTSTGAAGAQTGGGTPINLSCNDVTSHESFNPNVLFANHSFFLESPNAPANFNYDSTLPMTVNGGSLTSLASAPPSLFDPVTFAPDSFTNEMVASQPTTELANHSSLLSSQEAPPDLNFGAQSSLQSSLAQPSNFGIQFPNDVAYNLSACDLSMHSNDVMAASSYITASSANEIESLEYTRLLSPSHHIDCDATLNSCCPIEQRV